MRDASGRRFETRAVSRPHGRDSPREVIFEGRRRGLDIGISLTGLQDPSLRSIRSPAGGVVHNLSDIEVEKCACPTRAEANREELVRPLTVDDARPPHGADDSGGVLGRVSFEQKIDAPVREYSGAPTAFAARPPQALDELGERTRGSVLSVGRSGYHRTDNRTVFRRDPLRQPQTFDFPLAMTFA